MNKTLGTIAIGFCLSVCHLAPAATWHVDQSVSEPGDGTTWDNAFSKIQQGIDAAVDGDTVIVAQGTYVENIRFNGENIILRSTDSLDPAVVATTIIDGNQAGSVVTFSGDEDETCLLSGFTICNGSAEQGAAIYGGGWDNATHAALEDNVITANSATGFYGRGGGVAYCDGPIHNNIISYNSAGNDGGGLSRCGGAIRKNIIRRNSSGNHGGGLAGCHGTIQGNTITGNSAEYGGGGLSVCDASIQNNHISGNEAGRGGGLDSCHGTIHSNTISGNSATDYDGGGGLCCCAATIQNNTITANSANYYGGGLSFCRSTIRNCIIWGNTAPADAQLYESTEPTCSCIQDWTGGGEGNTAKDPRFVDLAGGDYHLREGSPCIDRGVNYYWFTWPQRDLDGNCRLVGERVDMGSYEYGSSPDSDGDLLCDSDESAAGTNPSRQDSDKDRLRDGLEVLRGSDPLERTPPAKIRVPADIPTIQKALCLAVTGDEVVVAPGTYPENLQFCGPDVILHSSHAQDPATVASTILHGGGHGPVVRFSGNETKECLLSGFSITGGLAEFGGGIWGGTRFRPTHSHATIRNNVVTGNSAQTGGGLCDCEGTIQNNVIAGNSAAGCGGGFSWCPGTIRNNTITANSAAYGGGLYDCDGTIGNCIIWGNTATGSGPQLWDSSTPGHCCTVQHPRFVDQDGPDDDPATYGDNNYRLSPDSPCVDAGMNEEWMWDAVDLDGNPRIFCGRSSLTVDMGAYEYNPREMLKITRNSVGEIELTWMSRPDVVHMVWSCTNLLSGTWEKEVAVASTGAATSWTLPAPLGRIKFYRVEMK